jgi:hypothetical protein
MDQEIYNKALDVWQAGPVMKDDYHASTGLISNSFIGAFQKCQYGAIIESSKILPNDQGFKQCFAEGHLTESQIFEGNSGFEKMMVRYGDDVYTKAGKPREWVNHCKGYAESVLRHDNIKKLLRSESSQYHKTLLFDMFGLKWKAEVDYLNLNKHVEVDLKSTKDEFSKRSWNDDQRARINTFIDEWNYHRQRAVYQKGIESIYDEKILPHILAVSKKNKSVRLFKFDNQDRLDFEIKKIKELSETIKPILAGEQDPKQCEECEHCVRDEIIDFAISVSSYCA